MPYLVLFFIDWCSVVETDHAWSRIAWLEKYCYVEADEKWKYNDWLRDNKVENEIKIFHSHRYHPHMAWKALNHIIPF